MVREQQSARYIVFRIFEGHIWFQQHGEVCCRGGRRRYDFSHVAGGSHGVMMHQCHGNVLRKRGEQHICEIMNDYEKRVMQLGYRE